MAANDEQVKEWQKVYTAAIQVFATCLSQSESSTINSPALQSSSQEEQKDYLAKNLADALVTLAQYSKQEAARNSVYSLLQTYTQALQFILNTNVITANDRLALDVYFLTQLFSKRLNAETFNALRALFLSFDLIHGPGSMNSDTRLYWLPGFFFQTFYYGKSREILTAELKEVYQLALSWMEKRVDQQKMRHIVSFVTGLYKLSLDEVAPLVKTPAKNEVSELDLISDADSKTIVKASVAVKPERLDFQDEITLLLNFQKDVFSHFNEINNLSKATSLEKKEALSTLLIAELSHLQVFLEFYSSIAKEQDSLVQEQKLSHLILEKYCGISARIRSELAEASVEEFPIELHDALLQKLESMPKSVDFCIAQILNFVAFAKSSAGSSPADLPRETKDLDLLLSNSPEDIWLKNCARADKTFKENRAPAPAKEKPEETAENPKWILPFFSKEAPKPAATPTKKQTDSDPKAIAQKRKLTQDLLDALIPSLDYILQTPAARQQAYQLYLAYNHSLASACGQTHILNKKNREKASQYLLEKVQSHEMTFENFKQFSALIFYCDILSAEEGALLRGDSYWSKVLLSGKFSNDLSYQARIADTIAVVGLVLSNPEDIARFKKALCASDPQEKKLEANLERLFYSLLFPESYFCLTAVDATEKTEAVKDLIREILPFLQGSNPENQAGPSSFDPHH